MLIGLCLVVSLLDLDDHCFTETALSLPPSTRLLQVPGCKNVPDIEKGAVGWLGPAAAKELLSVVDYSSWLEACLKEFTEQEKAANTLVRCPKCYLSFTTVVGAALKKEQMAPEPAPEPELDEPAVEGAVSSPPKASVMDALGTKRALTADEWVHFETNRFR